MEHQPFTTCQYCDSQTWGEVGCCSKKVLADGLRHFEEQRSQALSAVDKVDRAMCKGLACREMYQGPNDNPDVWSALKQLQEESRQFSQVFSDVLEVLDIYKATTDMKLELLSDPNDPVWMRLGKTHDTCAKVLLFLAHCGEALAAYASHLIKGIKKGEHVSEPGGLGAWLHQRCPCLASCLEDLGHSIRSNKVQATMGCLGTGFYAGLCLSAAQAGTALLLGGGVAVLAAGLLYVISALGRDITLAKKRPYCAAIQELMSMRMAKQPEMASEQQVEAILQVFSRCLDRPVFVDTGGERILSTGDTRPCAICLEEVRPGHSIVVSAANAQCSTFHWLHERCYQRYAATAGATASKCPSCQVVCLDVVKTVRVTLP